MIMQEIVIELRELRHDVQGLKQEMQRYKGFVGGVMWCMGALSAVGGFLVHELTRLR